MKKNTDHCTFRDNVMLCSHCGGTHTVPLPMEIKDFTKKVKSFIALHEDCKPVAVERVPADDTEGGAL